LDAEVERTPHQLAGEVIFEDTEATSPDLAGRE
jgi:hypothetical protein